MQWPLRITGGRFHFPNLARKSGAGVPDDTMEPAEGYRNCI